ncbi:hypothetical protein [Deinococcus sp. QL22]|uniref:hypothetical protein n=1 Tax=Deinococcus sp. QL22 TaxID=2939437 RepID=UPI002017240D|nr:hypothetical protein [Deinococcus sp. QL22]UQN10327.1 hypothetical protein M1R55_29690 [Deinococcus sp. QL22]UQN10461.1 hypothetical protein M1R55_29015 [Deinococcus sp. QL22]
MTDNPEYLRVAKEYGIDADSLRWEWTERSHPTLEAAAEAVRDLDRAIETVSANWAARHMARRKAERRAALPWFLRWLA